MRMTYTGYFQKAEPMGIDVVLMSLAEHGARMILFSPKLLAAS